MKVLVTGAKGFLGKNLTLRLGTIENVEVLPFTRDQTLQELRDLVSMADAVVHLAGVSRPNDPDAFRRDNVELTESLVNGMAALAPKKRKRMPVIFSSSIQAGDDSPYGRSKYEAECLLERARSELSVPVYTYRLPNVFGKWSRPDYNSVVATFCHNIARDLPIRVDDEARVLPLVYVDDVIETFLAVLQKQPSLDEGRLARVSPQYSLALGELARTLKRFRRGRECLTPGPVGCGLTRALYATYSSFLPTGAFTQSLSRHEDARGRFSEILKTGDAGQISFFTINPGKTRGGHYHHTKTEKFLVIRGQACFQLRHMVTGEFIEIETSGQQLQVLETVPGWAHQISNTGDEEVIVVLWANEVFDPDRPDTYATRI